MGAAIGVAASRSDRRVELLYIYADKSSDERLDSLFREMPTRGTGVD